MEYTIYDLVGNIGIISILYGYFMIQSQRWIIGENAYYPLINIFGSICILISIIPAFSLSVAILQSIWIIIGSYGVWSYVKSKS